MLNGSWGSKSLRVTPKDRDLSLNKALSNDTLRSKTSGGLYGPYIGTSQTKIRNVCLSVILDIFLSFSVCSASTELTQAYVEV